jgi:hypothetical protein
LKYLLAGDWHSELHEEAVFGALKDLEHVVVRFPWYHYFNRASQENLLFRITLRIQNKYLIGPAVNRLNRDLIALATEEQPDAIFIYRGSHIFARTLRVLRRVCPNSVLVGYNNDDPFSPHYPRWLWRHFIAGVPEYDLVLAYRKQNITDFEKIAAKRVHLLRSWFIPERNYPMQLSVEDQERFGCDVVFVGHYENDGRLECLEEVVRRGWKLRIFGPGYEWNSVLKKSPVLSGHGPVDLVWGIEYNRALCGARVALCFLSKLNRDTYTRRCFEIPACRTILMAEDTADLATLFESGREAVYFENVTDLGNKLDRLLSDPDLCTSIADAGYRRVWASGHDVLSRMREVTNWVQEIRETQYTHSPAAGSCVQ